MPEGNASPAGAALRPEMTPAEARAEFRAGDWSGQTGGLCPGYMQGNLAILPAELALDFARFCQRNPKPCPLVAIGDTGDPMLPMLGQDIDVRHDLPSYNVYRHGELEATVADLGELWRDDLVAFVLGCSFSFEEALAREGIPLRHLETGTVVPMYKTTLMTRPAGPFQGGTVVSMRPVPRADVVKAVEVTARFPATHGSPLHIGDPAAIGIADLDRPDWGEPARFHDGDVPVFWACGVTPQNVLLRARPPLCITHTPGSMLISDLPSRGSATH